MADFNNRGLFSTLARGWAHSALVEPRATTDIALLMLADEPSREGRQSLLSPQFDSLAVYPAPVVVHGISIWRTVGSCGEQEVVVDILLADSEYLRTALARRRKVELGSLLMPILAIEEVILLKTIAGRLQDQADREKIRAR